MKVLIDNVEKIIDKDGFEVINQWNTAFPVRVASHINALRGIPFGNKENFKVITGGHVYVLNYNPKTYVAEKPFTFSEYRETQKNKRQNESK